MQARDLVWVSTQRRKDPAIPKAFEPTLRSILQEKYVSQGLSIPAIQQYIRTEHDLTIQDHQIHYRTRKYNMRRTNRYGVPLNLMAPMASTTRSTSNAGSAASEHDNFANPGINQHLAEYPDRPCNPQPPALGVYSQLSQPADPCNSMGSVESAAELGEFSSSHEQALGTGSAFNSLRQDDCSNHSRGTRVKTTNRPIASKSTSVERFQAIFGTLFKGADWGHNLIDMSIPELHSSMRLAFVMLCCGQKNDASCCLEVLLNYWNVPESPDLDTTTIADPFLHSTNILMWLLQTSQCDGNDLVCFNLWQSCRQTESDRSQLTNDGQAFTFQHLLAVGRLALAAYAQGYKFLFKDLSAFWKLHGDTKLVRKIVGQTWCSSAFDYIDRKIRDPQSMDTVNPCVLARSQEIIGGIRRLLRWIHQQLLLQPTLIQNEGIDLEEIWHHIRLHGDGKQLERQLLLGYLSYQASRGNLQWELWFDPKDGENLPWNICLEWLLGEVPLLTLSILLSLVECEDAPPDVMTSQVWYTRMLAAIHTLQEDIEGTTTKFCAAVQRSCPPPVRFTPPGQRKLWVSPLKLSLFDTFTISGENLQLLTQRLVHSTALFGSIAHKPTGEQASAMALGSSNPTLFSKRRSSLSGFESLKSVYMRTVDRINRSRTSLSTCSSLYLRHLSVDGLSMTNSLLGSLMNISRSSLRHSFRSSLDDDQQDRTMSITTDGDVMELDT